MRPYWRRTYRISSTQIGVLLGMDEDPAAPNVPPTPLIIPHPWTGNPVELVPNVDDPYPVCQDCGKTVDELHRVRFDGVKQCFDCYRAEEGPQT